ncbi:MAG: Ldh family oxidoreductase [bacterium]|nr:Ldh family oxidoreductase [bacterium]
MNQPPETSIRVSEKDLYTFVSQAAQKVGLPKEKAELLAKLLVTNDLRGVFSHGTQQIATYARLMRDGKLNPNPNVQVINETPLSVTMDGDGGLGYFPAYEGTLKAIEKAKAQGVGLMSSRNHGHFGAAGIYSRLTVGHDLLTFVTSGAQLNLSEGKSIYSAGGGSPMSFCSPGDGEDPLVLDFGAMHDLYASSPHREEIARLAPGMVFRSIGLGAICQIWGGFLAGVPLEEERAVKEYSGANQGALVITFRIDLFADPDLFKQEMDAYVRQVKTLTPLEGFEQSHLPGGPEAERERTYQEAGIPVGPRHQERLENLAEELDLEVPWH